HPAQPPHPNPPHTTHTHTHTCTRTFRTCRIETQMEAPINLGLLSGSEKRNPPSKKSLTVLLSLSMAFINIKSACSRTVGGNVHRAPFCNKKQTTSNFRRWEAIVSGVNPRRSGLSRSAPLLARISSITS